MEHCIYCNTEAELSGGDAPICTKCLAKREKEYNSPPTEPEIRDALQAELLAAALRALEAWEALNSLTREIPSGLPHPDGTQQILNASREVTESRYKMMKAHRRVSEFIEHGTVPEDLKLKN
jgi:hypothetical protein